ncbi:MAG: ABC transporter permease [Acidimicrobiales bacterium]
MTDVVAAATTSGGVNTTAVDIAVRGTKRKRGGKLGFGGWLCIAWLTFVAVGAVLAPYLPLKKPDDPDFFVPKNAGIGTSGHLLGTDENGYDMFSRLIWGGRVSLVVGIAVLVIGMTIGGTIGLVAGFLKGRVEGVLMAVVDIWLAFPALLFLIAIVAFLGKDLPNILVGILIVSIPYFARISRATTLAYANREFVLAAEAAGASRKRILAREIMPNVILPMLAFGLLAVAIAIVAYGSLSFLGLTDPNTVDWGGMIAGGRNALQADGIAHPSLLPATMLFLTVLAVNFLGERFRSVFDVKDAAI